MPYDMILSIGDFLEVEHLISLYLMIKRLNSTRTPYYAARISLFLEALPRIIAKKTKQLTVDMQYEVLAQISRFATPDLEIEIIESICRGSRQNKYIIGKFFSTLIANYNSLLYKNINFEYAITHYKKYKHVRKNKYMLNALQQSWLTHILETPRTHILSFYKYGITDTFTTPHCFKNPVETFIQLCRKIHLIDLIPALKYIHADTNAIYQTYQKTTNALKKDLYAELVLKETILKELRDLFYNELTSANFVDFLIKHGVESQKAVDIFLWYPN